MTLRNRRRRLAPVVVVVTLMCATATPADAAVSCRGRRATILGTRGIDFIVGTAGPDVIAGRTGLDQIHGRGGDDVVCGGKGDDFIIGGDGNDRLYGEAGSDELVGDEGDDRLHTGPGRSNGAAGGPGDDHLFGDAGFDTANYLDSTTSVSADLSEGRSSGEGADTLTAMDGVYGTRFDDVIVGDASNNILVGAGGADRISSGGNAGSLGSTPASEGVDILVGDGDPQEAPGDDVLTGDPGLNVVDYSAASAAVQVDLGSESATGDGLDRLVNVQIVSGSRFADTMRGDDLDNAFRPFGGDDYVDGGGGTDTAVYATAQSGITADLGLGTATGEGSDTLLNVESLWGGPRSDQLVGDEAANSLAGVRGDDDLVGQAGNDLLSGGRGADELDGGDGTDACSGGETVVNCEPSAGDGPVAPLVRMLELAAAVSKTAVNARI